ncbi:MAG: lectin-like protein [Candidatus Poseidoniaceae archaeon]|jgi:hypothetical protein|nr:lectin-like protein [Candidatus Poseidoniaceae archaeon]
MKIKSALTLLMLILVSYSSLVSTVSAESIEEIQVISTEINPENGHTYHLLTASSWTDAAEKARSLDGYLVTVNNATENQWLYDTFAVDNNTTRHLWIGLSDQNSESDFRWHDGTPFLYRNWGDSQPDTGDDEDYVHITGTNMGTIQPGSWNDLEDDPQYFPVYGVVEVGEGANYALRFDGDNDHVVISETLPEFEAHIEIEAWINVPDKVGIQFITMLGDYGWGLYLNDGYLAYSNQYSISSNPMSNISIQENVWTHVRVIVDTQGGGEFFIGNNSAGMIDVNDSQIPQGDFGSNDCFQSGSDCDELYIGRMGAGCDCNYFRGMIDDLIISNAAHESAWQFTEGEGSTTEDYQGRSGDIIGAAWVMPDGTIVAQAIELSNNQDMVIEEEIMEGDTYLFFAELPENTQFASITVESSGSFEFDEDDFESEPTFSVYISHEVIPTKWDYEYEIEFWWGYGAISMEWPEKGTWWITIVANSDSDELFIKGNWELAPEPPSLEDMLELNDGIAVTNQGIQPNNGDPQYYYVELMEPLSELKVETWGGNGQCDLHIGRGVLPWIDASNPWAFIESETVTSDSSLTAHSSNQGNNEEVSLFDAKEGIYYVMMTAFRGCREVTIQADFTYPPDNSEPEDAVELFPSISYGPLSGYNGLDQYFYIDVEEGVERLEVDLSDGNGEAQLSMRYEQYPTWSTYDKHSNSPGAGDKIAFNDPTPGRWYILLGTDEDPFSQVMITASFEDRYVWSYDGEPIQLYNGEEISGINAPKDAQLLFFIDLDSIATELSITTWGDSGDIELSAEFSETGFDDFGFGGRQGNSIENAEGDGVQRQINIWFVNDRIDITMDVNEDTVELGIVATWMEIGPGIEPVPEPEQESIEITGCIDLVIEEFQEIDLDNDDDIVESELDRFYQDVDFDEIDLNKDSVIDIAELKQILCSCENELSIIFDQFDSNRVSLEYMSSVQWLNDYNFFTIDRNDDSQISRNEIDDAVETCTTTFDAFDRDGDGVVDAEDQFPDDPTESVDTDGDGVGDNSDFISTVDNDIIYTISVVVCCILIALLGNALFVNRKDEREVSWERNDDPLSEAFIQGEVKSAQSPSMDIGTIEEPAEHVTVSDLFD